MALNTSKHSSRCGSGVTFWRKSPHHPHKLCGQQSLKPRNFRQNYTGKALMDPTCYAPASKGIMTGQSLYTAWRHCSVCDMDATSPAEAVSSGRALTSSTTALHILTGSVTWPPFPSQPTASSKMVALPGPSSRQSCRFYDSMILWWGRKLGSFVGGLSPRSWAVPRVDPGLTWALAPVSQDSHVSLEFWFPDQHLPHLGSVSALKPSCSCSCSRGCGRPWSLSLSWLFSPLPCMMGQGFCGRSLPQPAPLSHHCAPQRCCNLAMGPHSFPELTSTFWNLVSFEPTKTSPMHCILWW